MPARTSSKAVRTLYRCLLGLSQNGARPQVFGPYGAAAYFAHANNKEDNIGLVHRFPSCAKEVRRLLRHALTTTPPPTTTGKEEEDAALLQDAFALLRYANSASAILFPKVLPSALPIFDYSSSAALPGEEVSFNFFEPRYLKLVEMALQNGNYFVFRMMRGDSDDRGGVVGGCSILLQIRKSVRLPVHNKNGSCVISVQCTAGPRIRIKSQDFIGVGRRAIAVPDDAEVSSSSSSFPRSSSSGKDESRKAALPPLAVATQFEIWSDESSRHDHDHNHDLEFMKQRRDILDLLSSLSDLNSPVLRLVGLPPINATDFSFWALCFCLAERDVAARQKLLACQNDQDRMNYVQGFLQFVCKHKQEEAARQKDN